MSAKRSSNVSTTDSQTPRHSYNTRFSARTRTRSPTPDVIASTPDVIATSSNGATATPPAVTTAPDVVTTYPDVVTTPRAVVARHQPRRIDIFPEPAEEIEIPPTPCVRPPVHLLKANVTTGVDRACRIFMVFVAIGCVIYVSSYPGYCFFVEKDLSELDKELSMLKLELKNVISKKESTDKKLEEITGLLRSMKSDAENVTELSGRCGCDGRSSVDSEMEVSRALDRFSADRTGKTDFAFEPAGGNILAIRNTENYQSGPTIKLFGIPLCRARNGPKAMINPGNLPGECWAFKGSKGTAVIRLSGAVRISSVSLEHIQRVMSPYGEISTAPKEFSIIGLKNPEDKDGELLGEFMYDIDGLPIQEFNVKKSKNAFKYIEFNVHSNNGHPDFTCIYRLRVHGTLEH